MNWLLRALKLPTWCRQVLITERKHLLVGFMLALSTALAGLGLLALSGWFITATAITGLAAVAGIIILLDVYLPGAGIRFFALTRTVSRYAERLYNHDVILRLLVQYRRVMFTALWHMPAAQLRQTSDSEWLSRLTADIDRLDSIWLRLLLPGLVATVVVLLTSVFISLFTLWSGLLVASAGIVIAFLLYHLMILRCANAGMQCSDWINKARQHSIDHLHGQLELHAMRQQHGHQHKLILTLQALDEAQHRLNRYVSLAQIGIQLCHGLLLLGVTVLALQAFKQQLFSGPVAVMLVLAIFSLIEVLQALPMQLSHWGQCQYAGKRLQQQVLAQQEQPGNVSPQQGALSLLHLSFTVRHQLITNSMVKPISAQLECGQLLFVQGRSGAGKTTLADTLAHLTGHSSSEITVNGQALTAKDTVKWQQQLAYLQQHNNVLADTLYMNLSLGKQIDEATIWQVLRYLELDSWARQLPQGLDSWLGDTGNAVSGGQARRLCLARLMLSNPQLVILDEPFNGIDNDMAARIWSQIQPWLSRRLTILFMHEQPAFMRSDNTLQIQQITLA